MSTKQTFSTRWIPRDQAQCPGEWWICLQPDLLFSCPQSLTLGGVIKIDGPTLSAVARVTRVTSEDTTPLFFIGVRFLTLRLARLQGTFVSESA